MQNEITTINPSSIREYAEAFWKLADMLVGGNSLPKACKTKSDLVMYMQASKDLGLTLTEAFNSLAFINGRMSMYGPKVIARARSLGYKLKFDEWVEKVKVTQSDGSEKTSNNSYCICTMWHKDNVDDVRTEKRDLLKANKAGLLSKDVWINYTETMLRYRAVNECIKFFAPEVLAGVSMYEEVKDITPDNFIDWNVGNQSWSIIADQVVWNGTIEWFSDFVEWGETKEVEASNVVADETAVAHSKGFEVWFEVWDIVKYKKNEYSIEEILDEKVILFSESGECITVNLSDIKYA